MRVGTAQYDYFIKRVNTRLDKLKLQLVDEERELERKVEYIKINRFLYTQLGLNVDKLLSYSNSNTFNYNKTYTSLSSVKLDASNLAYISSYFKLLNQHYNVTKKELLRLSIVATMPYSFNNYIIRLYNLNNLRKMFNGGIMYIGRNIGQINIVNKPRRISSNGVIKSIDRVATANARQAILDRNGILYNKQDALQAEKDGVEYKGEKYLVYYTSDNCSWFHFIKSNACKSSNIGLYRFIPSNLKNYDKTKYNSEDYYKRFTSANDIINDDNLGCVQKLYAMEAFNPNYIYALK